MQTQFGDEIAHARAADSERLDNAVHGIIDATRNQAVKDRLSGLDREIHRIFDAIESSASDPETAQTFELMRGIVILTTVMAAIGEARVDSALPSAGPDSGAADLATIRAEDTRRLDNTIHGIIDATRNPDFKEYLAGLDREIHRVFDSVEQASGDPETARTLELMEGIVVLSSIMNAIAETRIDQAADRGSIPVITVSAAVDGFTVLGAGFTPGERVIFTIAHTATAAVVIEGSLLNEQISANETGAFQATGTLPLGPGVYTLQATGEDSRLMAVAPVLVGSTN